MIVGKKIVDVRLMTDEEWDKEGWTFSYFNLVIILEDGTKIFASSDEEGNHPGCLFGEDSNGSFILAAAS